jgi:uncharacterized protein
MLNVLWHGLRDALLMGWQVWWALAFGFLISAVVQAWVPRTRVQNAIGGDGVAPVARATALGAASSSCSYAAVAIAKSLFQRGASGRAMLAFQFASTNLVWELGLVLWVLIGWRFTLAEWVGGIVMIVVSALLWRAFVPRSLETEAHEHAQDADTGHMHHMAGEEAGGWRKRLTSVAAWSDVAHNFRGDWQMLWKEIGIGLLLSGFVAQIHNSFWHGLFLSGGSGLGRALWGAVIGPLIAVATFVCSVGNVPLAAVLWSGGISFAGVVAFVFSDLLILPIVVIYRKYYGRRFTVRLVALMVVAIVIAALAVQGLFSVLGLLPSGPRPLRANVFGSVSVDYKLVLNVLGLVIFAALFGLTMRRGATDPVCRMTVDRAKSVRAEYKGVVHHFCCDGCRDAFLADPQRYLGDHGAAPAPPGPPSSGTPKHTTIRL